MSSDWERGFLAGWNSAKGSQGDLQSIVQSASSNMTKKPKTRKKVSAYNRFVKECAKKPRFRYKSGKKKNMLNMRLIGQAWRKKRK